MKKLIAIIIFLPVLIFANMKEEYIELFGEKFAALKIDKCKEILDEWEVNSPEDQGVITGLRAALILAEGDIQSSSLMMEGALGMMVGKTMSQKTADTIREYYQKALDFMDEEMEILSSNHRPYIELCKRKQPKGTRFQYWVGVAQIVAGCIAAPFSGGTSAILISMGTATVISAASDCLNNIEDWENELNRRQRISPDNTSYISPNQMTCFSVTAHI